MITDWWKADSPEKFVCTAVSKQEPAINKGPPHVTLLEQQTSSKNGRSARTVTLSQKALQRVHAELLTGLLGSLWLFSHHGEDFVEFAVLEFQPLSSIHGRLALLFLETKSVPLVLLFVQEELSSNYWWQNWSSSDCVALKERKCVQTYTQ